MDVGKLGTHGKDIIKIQTYNRLATVMVLIVSCWAGGAGRDPTSYSLSVLIRLEN